MIKQNNNPGNTQFSLDLGIITVDFNHCVTWFSPLALGVFALVDCDIGQPLIGIPTTISLPNLSNVLSEVISRGVSKKFEIRNEEVAYLVQVMPYRYQEGAYLGAVISLIDIAEQLALVRVAESSLREFDSLANGLDQVVWKRDHNMKQFLYISHQIERLTGWTPRMLIKDTGLFESAINTADRHMVSSARKSNCYGWTVTYRLVGGDGRELMLKEVATVVDVSDDSYVVGTLTDVTLELLVAKQNRVLAAGFASLVAHENLAAALVDESLFIVSAGIEFSMLLQQQPDRIKGKRLQELPLILELTPDTDFNDLASNTLSGDEVPDITKLISAVMEGRLPITSCNTIVRLTESPHTLCELTISLVTEAGRIEGMLLILRPAETN
jgi:two-component system CheB/CheR fusion protein